MATRARFSQAILLTMLAGACQPPVDGAGDPGGAGGQPSGGRAVAGAGGAGSGSGGAGGSGVGGSVGSGGSAGASAPGANGGAGGATGGTGGSSSAGTGGAPATDAGSTPDSVASADAAAGDGAPAAGPPAAGQGPIAEGTIKFSQDFEQNMNGMSRSPRDLPEDRITIVPDPVKERGNVVRIMFKAGDNFRTSPGTQPRSWYSAAMGYTVKPNTKVSVAWGFMWENPSMNAHFAQLIREGGPTWMWDVDGAGFVSMTAHRGTGRTGNIVKLEPMKWYDFMVVTDYRNGGDCRYYFNGKLVATGKSPGGPDGRFDFGIYTRPGAHPARTVYLSNVSIGELP